MKKLSILFTTVLFLTVFNGYTQIGSTCLDPHVVSSLPFSATGLSTANSGNNYSSLPCSGTFPNYLNGNEYVFTFTPAITMDVKIALTNTASFVAVFVTSACPDVATACIANNNSPLGNPIIQSVTLNGGTTYYITVSRSATAGISTDFNLEITRNFETDGAIIKVNAPTSDCYLSNNEQVVALVKNVGTQAISGFDLGYSVNGTPTTPENITTTLNPGDTLVHTFSQTADLSQAGTYQIAVYVVLNGDMNPINDTLVHTAIHYPVISTLPYTEDFESGAGGWSVGGLNPSWALGTPAGTVINTPATGGTNSWVTNLTGNHNLFEDSYVYSPCFDFTNYTNLSAKLDIWYQTSPMFDGARLEASINGGNFWFIMGKNNEPTNWYNGMMTDTIWTGSSYGWIGAQRHLDLVGGQSNVRFRIRYKTGLMSFMTEEGFAFDNFEIYECTNLPTAGFTYTQNGADVSFTNTSTNATNYVWDFGDGMSMMLPDTSTNPTYQYMMPDIYMVTLAAYNECGVSYYQQSIDATIVNINSFDSHLSYSIYPNPAKDKITIQLPMILQNELYSFEIYDIIGQKVIEKNIQSGITYINLSNLKSGIYNVVINSNSTIYKEKLIIQ